MNGENGDESCLDVEKSSESGPVKVSNPSWITRFSHKFIRNFEQFFFNWGVTVAKSPCTFIVICLVVAGSFSLGLLNFTAENRPLKLWIPQESGFVKNSEWLQDHFPNDMRFHSMIVEHPHNVLTPDILRWMLQLHHNTTQIVSANGYRMKDVCYRLPVLSDLDQEDPSRRKRAAASEKTENQEFDFDFTSFDGDFHSSFDTTFDKGVDPNFEPSIDLPLGVFCDMVEDIEDACFENNILEIWKYDEKIINDLTEQDILDGINAVDISNLTQVSYSSLLGKVRYNSTGSIVAAGSVLVQIFTRVNFSLIVEGGTSNDAGTGDVVDPVGLDWEAAFLGVVENATVPGDQAQLFFMASRSFGDISGTTILGDVQLLMAGTIVVFMYVQLMLGKFNMVEQRAFLSMMGLASVGMAILVSFGLCAALGVFYGPVHSILPFLLLGIGIDDMFVITQCYSNLSKEDLKRSLPIQIGTTMRHAGVSITITSITDFAAFAVGSSTVLPSLRSFCIYSAIGILATFMFQATFFVGWLALDQRRIDSHRDGMFPWYKHRNWKPSKLSRIEPLKLFFSRYLSKFLFKTPVKVLVLVLTATSLGFNVWGSVLMRQEFNPLWFIPSSTYLSQYFRTLEEFYPSNGELGTIYVKSDHLFDHLDDLEDLIGTLGNQTDIVSSVDDWFGGFKDFVVTKQLFDLNKKNLTSVEFHTFLKNYLYSLKGGRYRKNFKFDGNLDCRHEQAPPIIVTNFDFVFHPFSGREEHIPAMQRIKKITEDYSLRFQDQVFPWARIFASWETDEVIMEELYRNLIIAMICVFVTTFLLIANIYACFLVLLCVTLTLVCVNGTMHFWGLTIDTVSCINLVLAIGLCVDYAAHVAHTFMIEPGTRNERAARTITSIGPAVFHGGFSTFLAFIFLADSDSHVFLTFFKIFVLVVIYGLYHGLIFFPVLLSLIGPKSFDASRMVEIPMLSEELEP